MKKANKSKVDALKTALKGAKNPDIHMVPDEKMPKGMEVSSTSEYYYPPDLHLSTKDFPGVKDFKAGETVVLAITAKVESMNMHERQSAGEKKTEECNATFRITAISDITDGGKK